MLTIPITLLLSHLVGDFFFQSDKMAIRKSKSWDWLWWHACVYSLCFCPWGFKFQMITLITHFLTDAVTSRITTKLWFIDFIERPLHLGFPVHPDHPLYAKVIAGNRHWFFTAIGVDQFIHYLTLAITYKWLIG